MDNVIAQVEDLSDLDALDEAEMAVAGTSSWKWRFAGPGHPMGVAQSNRISKQVIQRRRLQEQATINQKKWKADEKTPDEQLTENVNFVLERLLGWSPINMNGVPYEFSMENARKLLMDPRKGSLLQQAVEFILEDNSFTKRSAKS